MTESAEAPYYRSCDADGPESGKARANAFWVRAADGVRIRVVEWRLRDPGEAPAATVLVLSGRAEFAEKYHETALGLVDRGFVAVTLDWRGQGLSDRIAADPGIGHVGRFSDFQMDLQAMLAAIAERDLPAKKHMLAHSMGGAIGLRALANGIDVETCAFSAPMWSIRMSPTMRALALGLTGILDLLGRGEKLMPGMHRKSYVLSKPFDDNVLTSDRAMYEMLRKLGTEHPEFGLGGPSARWIAEALRECSRLAALPSPDIPCLTFLGEDERVVDPQVIIERMDRWPGGKLENIPGGRHEVLNEAPAILERVLDSLAAHIAGAGGGGGS